MLRGRVGEGNEMACLSIRLLGPFQVELESEPVEGFKSDKVRALLAYLAVESERPHRRESLAGLLWPNFPERSARVNLRGALANLRQVIGDRDATCPLLRVAHGALEFNSAGNACVDVTTFIKASLASLEGQEGLSGLEAALRLYRKPFLEGFSLADSPTFEEWVLLIRERCHRLATDGLGRLSAHYEAQAEFGSALAHAHRRLELDPLLESAHRQVMRLLARCGERGAALAQYRVCAHILAEELGAQPSRETEQLHEQILGRDFEAMAAPRRSGHRPAYIGHKIRVRAPGTVFVARERELAWLRRAFEGAMVGKGQVAFVIGGPGRGKTALLKAFAAQAQTSQPELLVASGNGNAYSGIGDPYLPFREVLEMLSGDVEARWAAGAIEQDHALRLWHALPLTVRALVDVGPDLIESFLPGRALASRAATYYTHESKSAMWLTQLEALVTRKLTLPPDPNLQQSALLAQYTRVLTAVARQRPLLVILDDLQWADSGTASLLFRLGRELPGSRILIVGAYRSEELGLGLDGGRHALEGVLAEFKRRYGDVWLDLAQTTAVEGRNFVDALLDHEANHLGHRFRRTLFRHAEGHPLFTAELLRMMQQRGDLVREANGAWIEGPALDWETLPPRVEGVIAERIRRLDDGLGALLAVASVEGEEFTAQVVAHVLNRDERSVIRSLSNELEQKHRLVSTQGVRRLNETLLSLHRFRHNLFQKHVYAQLNAVERACLHGDVGNALETLHSGHAEELAAAAPRLARHFEAAGNWDKAIVYLRQSGERATRMSANEEAIAHFSWALELLTRLPKSPGRNQLELELQLNLGVPLLVSGGWATPEMSQVVGRTRELCEQVGETPQLFAALWFAYTFHGARGENQMTLALAQQLLALAERSRERGLIMLAHYALAYILLAQGDCTAALTHAQLSINLYNHDRHHILTFSMLGHNPKAQCLETCAMARWVMGYPDQARECACAAVDLAQSLDHPYTLALAVEVDGLVQSFCGDWPAAREREQRARDISREHGLLVSQALASWSYGLALVKEGRIADGMEFMHQSKAILTAAGTQVFWTLYLAYLAEGYVEAGQLESAMQAIAEGIVWLNKTKEDLWEPEIHRLQGQMSRQQGDAVQAEVEFLRAIEVSRQQGAKSLELRASADLAEMWQQQGKIHKAQEMLGRIFGWFSEGLDTADLRNARELLDALEEQA